MYLSKLPNLNSASKNHTQVFNIDDRALWQSNEDYLSILSENKLNEASLEVNMKFNENDSHYFTWDIVPMKRLGRKNIYLKGNDVHEYIKTKAMENGFDITKYTLRFKEVYLEHKKFTFKAVRIIGELKITNTDDFEYAVLNGVGRAKCYGFSLLNIWG
jgi:hypothetical protein